MCSYSPHTYHSSFCASNIIIPTIQVMNAMMKKWGKAGYHISFVSQAITGGKLKISLITFLCNLLHDIHREKCAWSYDCSDEARCKWLSRCRQAGQSHRDTHSSCSLRGKSTLRPFITPDRITHRKTEPWIDEWMARLDPARKGGKENLNTLS